MTTTSLPSKSTPVLSRPTDRHYSGSTGDYLEISHRAALELKAATISLSFSLDQLYGDMALISKDLSGYGAGQFSVWIKDGTIHVYQDSDSGYEHIKIPELVLSADTTYQFALSFGGRGLEVWLNGELVGAEPTFKQGMMKNDAPLVIGATRSWRSDPTDEAHSLFKGSIGDVQVYSRQLGESDMVTLAEAVDPALGMSARMAQKMADLTPAFEQMHSASDTLKEIASDFGISEHGHMMRPLTMKRGGTGANTMNGSDKDDGLDGNAGNDTIDGKAGNDVLQGSYGNDVLRGSAGGDILDGGHGEDRLFGGAGDDLLISRADAREPKIAYVKDRDEGDPEKELTQGKLYPNQPIHGDDAMTGGDGADIFYFQTLINAKKRYIEKHTNDDGTVRWHGVAGENDKLHDHWVDHIGYDVVMDYNRAEGDRLVIEGHTTEIWSISYSDANGDGVMDRSLIRLYSEQGSGGGAHNQDKLGSITVYGDLVKLSDIETTAAPAYGIVATTADIAEALKPTKVAKDRGNIKAPKDLPEAEGLTGGKSAVYSLAGTHEFSGKEGDYLDAGHVSALELKAATISLSFSLDQLYGDMALISKDLSGYGAGQFSVWIKDGTIHVYQDSDSGYEHIKIPELVLSADTTYQFALSFGGRGLEVWLNGELVGAEPTFKQGMMKNDAPLVIGATRSWRSDPTDEAHSLFKGSIGDVQVYSRQLGESDMATLAGAVDPALGMSARMAQKMADLTPAFEQMHSASDTLKEIASDFGISEHGHMMRPLTMKRGGTGANTMNGSDKDDGLDGNAGNDTIDGKAGNDVLQGGYGNDVLRGSAGGDILDGGHGEDILFGGAGDDLLISRADAREPKIAYVKGRDEGDPEKELTQGKLYPNQPIHGDDAMTGGDGADIFYFQTLINAKKRYIEKHTNDDGTVRWHGVAGENDKLHDHWVDHIGYDVVMDYNRAEGDRLVIEGHTTEIWSISYSDANGDGVMDRSLIRLYSEQGSGGGAHNQDKLGSITVYGDLVKLSDIETTAAPAYGIVATTADIAEALKPTKVSKDRGNIKAPKDLPEAEETEAANGLDAVFAIPTENDFEGISKNALIFDHSDDLAIRSGIVALSYTTGSTVSYGTLFSKDATDYGKGGHLTAYVEDDGDIVVRLQTKVASYWMVARDILEADTTYDIAVSFGNQGAALFVDGVKIAYDADLTQKLNLNGEALIVGASGSSNSPGTTDRVHSGLVGTIEEFAIYDRQLTMKALYGSATPDGMTSFDGSVEAYRFTTDSSDKLVVKGGGDSVTIGNKVRFLDFDDLTVRPDDVQVGDWKDDVLRGTAASEILVAGKGNDVVYGDGHDDFIDGGEGDDRLYAGAGEDLVLGGDGADYIDGGVGDDTIKGGLGNDEIKGGEGKDLLYGGLGDDAIFGNSWGTGGLKSEKDTVVYDGNYADYLITTETYYNSTRGANEQRLVVTDSYNGGADTYYEGRDLLYDVDKLKFADQVVLVDDIA